MAQECRDNCPIIKMISAQMANSDSVSNLPFSMGGDVIPEQRPDFRKRLDDALRAASGCSGPKNVDTEVRVIFTKAKVTVTKVICGLEV